MSNAYATAPTSMNGTNQLAQTVRLSTTLSQTTELDSLFSDLHASNLKDITPFALLSKEEQKEFQAKFRQFQRSPQMMDMQIKSLDQLIAFLKQKRLHAQTFIDNNMREIRGIESEQQMYYDKLAPIDKSIQQKKSRMAFLMQQLEATNTQNEEVVSDVRNNLAESIHALQTLSVDQIRSDLQHERGWQTTRDSNSSNSSGRTGWTTQQRMSARAPPQTARQAHSSRLSSQPIASSSSSSFTPSSSHVGSLTARPSHPSRSTSSSSEHKTNDPMLEQFRQRFLNPAVLASLGQTGQPVANSNIQSRPTTTPFQTNMPMVSHSRTSSSDRDSAHSTSSTPLSQSGNLTASNISNFFPPHYQTYSEPVMPSTFSVPFSFPATAKPPPPANITRPSTSSSTSSHSANKEARPNTTKTGTRKK